LSVRLTEFSHGAGCGCKIAPDVLDRILHTGTPEFSDPRLLVGNNSRDDAAVADIGNGMGIISTTDFFMPVVDNPYDFGRIAGANAISDVYAMGGQPLMAIAILGWPVDRLAPEIAGEVLDGGRAVCAAAGITLAGGHSIDSPEPIFGLAVTGQVATDRIIRNDTARAGDLLSVRVSEKPLAAGLALAIWFFFVLIFDLVLLGVLVASEGKLNPDLLPWLLLLNPTDIYRLLNIVAFEGGAQLTGVLSLGSDLPMGPGGLWVALAVWFVIPLAGAWALFRNRRI